MKHVQSFKIGVYLMVMVVVLQPHANSQTSTIFGTIKDAATKQGIGFCSISLIQHRTGATSNLSGNFKLTIPQVKNQFKIVVFGLGYKPDTIQLDATKNRYEILLTPSQSVLNDVVVTGVSKATLIRQNPVAVVKVSAKAIEQTTESNIIDVLVKNVPGLNAVKTGPNISKPFIRGLGYNRVLTLYDGIRREGQQWGDEHGIEVDAYIIDKAEVIKGPASIMYGSDAVAGVVSLMPAMSTQKDGKLHGKYVVEYQHNNGLIGDGVRFTVANNHFSYAFNGSYRTAKNYLNAVDGRVYNTGFQEANASGSAQYISDKGTFNLNATLYDNLQGIPDGSRDSLTRQFTKQVAENINDDLKNRPIVTEAELNNYALSPLHQHIQHYRIYSNNHYLLGTGDIDFQLAFQQNIRREYNHPTVPEQAGMFVRLNTFNYGFRYNAPTIINTEISIGINGMYQQNKNKNSTDFPIPDYKLFDAGSYLFAKWKKNKFTISGGFRYDTRQLTSDDFYTALNASTGFDMHANLPDTIGSKLQFAAINKSFNGSSLSVGVTCQLNEHINLKANVAKGYRSPSITEYASNGLDPGAHIVYLGNRNFVPEFSLQEDIGIDLHGKIFSASLSIFNNNIQHYIYLSQLTDANNNPIMDAQGNKTYQYQQAAAILYGFEVILNYHPIAIEGFSFSNACSNIYGFNKKVDYINKGINGEYLPLIPPFKLLSSINQNIKLASTFLKEIDAKIEAEINGAQNKFLSLNETETATPAFNLFNIAFGTKINYAENCVLQFQVQINNLFDKAYQSNLSRLKYLEYYTNSTSGFAGIYNMGRNICLKLMVPF